jgi:hypothetical protein
LALKPNAVHGVRGIYIDRARIQAFDEGDAFFQRFLDFFVIERVGGRIEESAPICNRRAAPALQELDHPRRAVLAHGRVLFSADRASVRKELLADFAFFCAPTRAHCVRTAFSHQRLESNEEFLDLYWVVRKRFGRGVDRGEPTTDDHHRQAQLHVRDRIAFGGTGELQRHQEIAGRTHAARQAIRNIKRRGFARAHRERNVIEPEARDIIEIQGAAKAHAA